MNDQVTPMCSITTLARADLPSPMGSLQVGHSSLPSALSLPRQGEQVMWPEGQQGTGPYLGTTRHTGHSTFSCSAAISTFIFLLFVSKVSSLFSLSSSCSKTSSFDFFSCNTVAF